MLQNDENDGAVSHQNEQRYHVEEVCITQPGCVEMRRRHRRGGHPLTVGHIWLGYQLGKLWCPQDQPC